jgi:hypothetical protein
MEMQRLGVGADGECDAEATAEIFLEPGRAGEALAAVDRLREAAQAAIEPGPELACAIRVPSQLRRLWTMRPT